MSFLQIVEEVKKVLAIQYLKNDDSSIKEIANTFGYAEQSGFVRAFKNGLENLLLHFKNYVYN